MHQYSRKLKTNYQKRNLLNYNYKWLSKCKYLSTSQIVEPVRQLKGLSFSLKTKKDIKNYYIAEYLKEIGILNKENLDSNYPVKPFQRPHLQ